MYAAGFSRARATQPECQPLGACRDQSKVARRAAGHDTVDSRAGAVGVGAFEPGRRVGHPQQRDQVSAGRIADGTDPVGVDLVVRRVFAHPADRAFAILDLRRKLVLRRQAIVDRHAREAGLGQPIGKAVKAVFAAATPPTAVNHEHARKGAVTGWNVHVGFEPFAVPLDVRHVAHDLQIAVRSPSAAKKRPAATIATQIRVFTILDSPRSFRPLTGVPTAGTYNNIRQWGHSTISTSGAGAKHGEFAQSWVVIFRRSKPRSPRSAGAKS